MGLIEGRSLIEEQTWMSNQKADATASLLNAAEAEEARANCAPEEVSFRYVAEHGPKWSRIAVYDAEGFHLGYL